MTNVVVQAVTIGDGTLFAITTDGVPYASAPCPECAVRYVLDALRHEPTPMLPYKCRHGREEGKLVVRLGDDSDQPVIGLVTGWRDTDWCWVLWPGNCSPVCEPMDDLMPRGR